MSSILKAVFGYIKKGHTEMSALELTRKIESLPQEDFEMIVNLVNRLADSNPFGYMTEADFVAELASSIDRSDEGETKSARTVAEKMRNKYAI